MVTQWLFFMIAFFGAGTLPDGPFWGEVAEDSGLHGQWQGEPEASVEVLPSKYLDDLDVGYTGKNVCFLDTRIEIFHQL